MCFLTNWSNESHKLSGYWCPCARDWVALCAIIVFRNYISIHVLKYFVNSCQFLAIVRQSLWYVPWMLEHSVWSQYRLYSSGVHVVKSLSLMFHAHLIFEWILMLQRISRLYPITLIPTILASVHFLLPSLLQLVGKVCKTRSLGYYRTTFFCTKHLWQTLAHKSCSFYCLQASTCKVTIWCNFAPQSFWSSLL